MARAFTNRKSGLVLRGGSMRRKTFWFAATDTVTTLAAGANPVLLLSLNAAALTLRPFTVVRTRGMLYVTTDQEAADEQFHVAYGKIIVSEQASAIGVTAIPTPRTDSQSDWFVYEWLMSDIRFGDATGFSRLGQNVTIDSKAQRKVEEGQDIVTVIEAGVTGAGSMVSTVARILIKLH